MSDHSNVSPSGASRFFACPGSVQAQAKITLIQPSNSAALEGLAIHELSADCMIKDIDPYTQIGMAIDVKDNYGDVVTYTVNDDMAFTARMYRNTILNTLEMHGVGQKALQIETAFKLPEVDKDCRGTVDCSFIAGDTLYVIDLKSGRGIVVDPEENKQCMYYALRPYLDAKMFISKIVIGIIQPRAKEGDYIKWWETTPQRLESFMADLTVAIAHTRVKKPEFNAGDHCTFCKAQGNCPVLQKDIVTVAQNVLPQLDRFFPVVTELTPEQIGNALPVLGVLKGFIQTLESYAFTLAKKGSDVPNYSLTRGRKNRGYIDEQAVIEEFGAEVCLAPGKIRTPAQLEKIVGKKELSEFVMTPEGSLKLVPTKEAQEYISRKVEDVFKDVEIN